MSQTRTPSEKYQIARSNLLGMIILTAANVLLISFQTEWSFSFAAFVPTFLAAIGVALEEEWGIYFAVSPVWIAAIMALAVTGLYLLCWGLSKAHRGWMIAALTLFSIDCALMLFTMIGSFEFSYLIDLAFHGWVMYYLILGVRQIGALRNQSDDVIPEMADVPAYAAAAAPETDFSTAPTMTESAPLRAPEQKGRVLVSADCGGMHIEVRRSFKLTELIINGWVYAEQKGLVEASYAMTAVVNGQLIQARMEQGFTASMVISVNGTDIARKTRWY